MRSAPSKTQVKPKRVQFGNTVVAVREEEHMNKDGGAMVSASVMAFRQKHLFGGRHKRVNGYASLLSFLVNLLYATY